jgi:glycosyltransferase involved in cell wall biosynthesis
MELTDHEDVLVVDEPEDFARALIKLYESEELWTCLCQNGLKTARALYSTDAARQKLELLFCDEHLHRVRRPATVEQTEIAMATRN